MTGTPNSERLHIVLAGERNSGKSSLLNLIAGQQVSIVSDIPGTTTDHVSKAMEIPGLGACLLVDTAGLDDKGELGRKRVGAALDVIEAADVIVAAVDATTGSLPDIPVGKVPVVPIINKCDAIDIDTLAGLVSAVKTKYGKNPVTVSAMSGKGRQDIISAIQDNIPEDWNAPLLTAGLLEDGDTAVLVMPQDRQAPKGRLILPQQQTVRELLDRHCIVLCCDTESLPVTLASLKGKPAAVIADSQALGKIKDLIPEGTRLTSFSMLLAASKGDFEYFRESVRTIDSLSPESRVLIAEACTHVPASEDIGRVQIPRLLRSRAGEGLMVDAVSGHDFPEDLSRYDLIIHCGACMFNRRYVLARVQEAKRQGVPMTNYGITIAYINNLLQI